MGASTLRRAHSGRRPAAAARRCRHRRAAHTAALSAVAAFLAVAVLSVLPPTPGHAATLGAPSPTVGVSAARVPAIRTRPAGGPPSPTRASRTARVVAAPVLAAPAGKPKDLTEVINRLRNVLVGLLVAIATLFLVIAGLLWVVAGGDMRAIETAKGAVKSAVIGYVIAAAATLIVAALKQVVS